MVVDTPKPGNNERRGREAAPQSLFLAAFLIALLRTAHAQDEPAQLLKTTAANYRQMDGYTLQAHAVASVPDVPTKMRFALTIAVLPATHAEGTQYGKFERLGPDPKETGKPLPAFGMPATAFGHFDRIATDVAEVHLGGREPRSFNGQTFVCDVLNVRYKPWQEGPHWPEYVTYWISPEKHLVLESKTTVADPGSNNVSILWNTTVESGQLTRVPPQWLLDVSLDHSVPFIARQEWTGRPAPNFTLRDRRGATFTLAARKGQAVLLDFWSTTCGPCIMELPVIEKITAQYAGTGLAVRGVSSDRPGDAEGWLDRKHQTLENLADPKFEVETLYKVKALPTLVLIGRDGKVNQYWVGTVPEATLYKALTSAVDSKSTP